MTRVEPSLKIRLPRILAVLGISVVLAATIPAVVSAQEMLEASATAGLLTASGSPEATDYAVTFVESGLPPGTSWNVTIDGTVLSSTSTDIVFHEPDGSYLFSVSSVPGYSTNPEGNVTVNGAPVTVPILFTSTSTGTPGCTSYYWQGGNYSFNADCRGSFEIHLRSFNATSGNTFENSTFDVGALAEVDSAGNLAALLVTSHESTGTISVVSRANGVNITDSITANVTTAIGLNASSGSPNGQVPIWSPNEALAGGLGGVGPTVWGSGSQVLGNADVVIVLHFLIGSQASNRVEFDVSISGWPWVDPADSLGLEVGATAEQQTYFAYTAANDTIAQRWSSNGTVASSLVFGASANVTVGDTNSTLAVTDQVGLYPSGTAPDIAFALLSFQGPGGYSALTYDPWVVFGPTPTTVIPPGGPGASAGATLPLLAVVGIVLAAALLGLVAYRLRRRRVDEGLRSPFQGGPTYWL